MDINEFCDNPPAGCEVVANFLRQAGAKLKQSQEAHEKALLEVRRTEAQLNADTGAFEAIKACAGATLQSAMGGQAVEADQAVEVAPAAKEDQHHDAA